MSQSSNSTVPSETSTLEYTQEPFETFCNKICQLCVSINLGPPTEIERIKGGSYNRVIGLVFPTTPVSRYVIRIPREPLDSDEAQNIKHQVAVLRYLSARLPVAHVRAYDCTTNNVIKSQYVIQQRLPGMAIADVYTNLALDDRLQIVKSIAELIQKVDSIVLPRFGRLVQKSPMSPPTLCLAEE